MRLWHDFLHKLCPWDHRADRMCVPQNTGTQLLFVARLRLPNPASKASVFEGEHADILPQLVGCRLACCMAAKQLRGGHNCSTVESLGLEGLPPICSAGVDPLWMAPVEDAEFGVAHHVTAEAVEAALALAGQGSGPPCSAVLITSPTYYGACSDAAGGPPCESDMLQLAGSGASLCACCARKVRQL